MSDLVFNMNCGFFDSVNKDRLYSADQMNRPYKRLVSNGVFATTQGTPSTDLQVFSANDNMNVIVKKGEGIFGDKWFENSTDLVITVPSNTYIVPRIDSIIVQIDKRTSGRVGNIVYRTGTPSSNPEVPTINEVDNVIEYRLANIRVAAGAVYIGQEFISDLRGSKECPWVTHLLKQIDTSSLYEQWQAAYLAYYNKTTKEFNEYKAVEIEEFNTFMEQLTSQLTVNTNIITYESHYITSVDRETEIPINITNYNKNKDVLLVRINHLFASEGSDYSISEDSSKIILEKDLCANQNIDFLVLQSVIVGDTETVLIEIKKLSEAIGLLNSDTGWLELTLENDATSLDENMIPSCRLFGNRVDIRGSITGVTELNTVIFTLPNTMCPSRSHIFISTAIKDGEINSTIVLEIKTDGTVSIIAKNGDIQTDCLLNIATNFVID